MSYFGTKNTMLVGLKGEKGDTGDTGGTAPVVQVTGQSTESVMSQKAVTDELNAKCGKLYKHTVSFTYTSADSTDGKDFLGSIYSTTDTDATDSWYRISQLVNDAVSARLWNRDGPYTTNPVIGTHTVKRTIGMFLWYVNTSSKITFINAWDSTSVSNIVDTVTEM